MARRPPKAFPPPANTSTARPRGPRAEGELLNADHATLLLTWTLLFSSNVFFAVSMMMMRWFSEQRDTVEVDARQVEVNIGDRRQLKDFRAGHSSDALRTDSSTTWATHSSYQTRRGSDQTTRPVRQIEADSQAGGEAEVGRRLAQPYRAGLRTETKMCLTRPPIWEMLTLIRWTFGQGEKKFL